MLEGFSFVSGSRRAGLDGARSGLKVISQARCYGWIEMYVFLVRCQHEKLKSVALLVHKGMVL